MKPLYFHHANCQMRRGLREWLCLLESLLFHIPCLATERWFFRHTGGWRERIGTRCVQGYYGAGRAFPGKHEREMCVRQGSCVGVGYSDGGQ